MLSYFLAGDHVLVCDPLAILSQIETSMEFWRKNKTWNRSLSCRKDEEMESFDKHISRPALCCFVSYL
jgi:hypothetical protein